MKAAVSDSSTPPSDWHHLDPDTVCSLLDSAPLGLSHKEAAQRLQRFGPNTLPAARRRPAWRRLLAQFQNSIIYLMLAAALVTAFLQHWIDTGVILAVLVVNAIVGFLQEGRAEQALHALRDMLAPHAQVLRAGSILTVPAADLVPGDIVLLEAGDRVPADMRLLQARHLLIDESILTGESLASEKNTAAAPLDSLPGDRTCMAHSGSLVLAGQARGMVTATGQATEIGRINSLLASVDMLQTPLLRQVDRFSQRFTGLVLGGGLVLMLFAVFVREYAWSDALLAVVSLAASIVPEGLPAVMTITLAIGVRRMAARNAIVRNLPAVEILGATSIICSDKTGTLTCNEMTVRRLQMCDRLYHVEGSGYAPTGQLREDCCGQPGAAMARTNEASGGWPAGMRHLLHAATLCNTARLRCRQGEWQVEGDPMEGALLAAALKAGIDPDTLRNAWPEQDQIPFNPEKRMMASLHIMRPDLAPHWHLPDGQRFVYVKGAPEQLLQCCVQQMAHDGTLAPLDTDAWLTAITAAADQGERVLGFAVRAANPAKDHFTSEHPGDTLTFLGLASLIDPPRPEAIRAIAECTTAGIRVKMITGDHALTAAAIARQLGLGAQPTVLTGADLDGIADAELPARAMATTVFARTSPEHKLRIVRALQSQGAVVAMTGDGVNDAPALKQADVGVAMGNKGTEAAKEASRIVLADDNFASIAAAVHEGRTVYDNIRKVIAWTLPTNGGEVLFLILALLLGYTLPMTPAQILWINLATTATLGLVLAFEPSAPDVMQRPPRPANAPLLSRPLIWRIILVSVFFLMGGLAMTAYADQRGYTTEHWRTLVVNVIVGMEIAYLFSVRGLHHPHLDWRQLLGTRATLAALLAITLLQAAFTYLPWMNTAFQTVPLSLADWFAIMMVALVLFLILEAEKKIASRFAS